MVLIRDRDTIIPLERILERLNDAPYLHKACRVYEVNQLYMQLTTRR